MDFDSRLIRHDFSAVTSARLLKIIPEVQYINILNSKLEDEYFELNYPIKYEPTTALMNQPILPVIKILK